MSECAYEITFNFKLTSFLIIATIMIKIEQSHVLIIINFYLLLYIHSLNIC